MHQRQGTLRGFLLALPARTVLVRRRVSGVDTPHYWLALPTRVVRLKSARGGHTTHPAHGKVQRNVRNTMDVQ